MMMMMMMTMASSRTHAIDRARVRRKATGDVRTHAKSVAIVGASSLTGRLVSGLASARVAAFDAIAVVHTNDKAWNEDAFGMPQEMIEKRMNASVEALGRCQEVREDDANGSATAVKASDVVVVAHESGERCLHAVKTLISENVRKDARVVMLSRVGVNRRSEKPFAEQNGRRRAGVKVGDVTLAIGKEIPGSVGALDAFAEAESALAKASSERGFAVAVVRSGQLRGNGPLLLADLSARLVDNLYDVKYQDVYVKGGDQSEGYSKRLNVAAVVAHLAEFEATAARVKDVEVLSVVTKTNFFGEQTLTPPTDRERRKGYDMAKGRAPPAVDSATIERLLADV